MSESVSVLDKQIVTKLNRRWTAVDFMTVREAVVFLASEADNTHPGFAMDYETAIDENGNHVLVYANPVPWEEWIKLPVRKGDLAIHTGRGDIRVPLVVVCAHYDKVPTKTTRWSTGNVHRRDGYVCAYTGRKLSHAEASVDHILPRSRGGRDEWTNTVSCDRKVNTLKANKTPEEAGLKLLRKPKAPPTMPVVITKADARDPSQTPFLI